MRRRWSLEEELILPVLSDSPGHCKNPPNPSSHLLLCGAPFQLGETCGCSLILLTSSLISISSLKLPTLKHNSEFLHVTYKLKTTQRITLGQY